MVEQEKTNRCMRMTPLHFNSQVLEKCAPRDHSMEEWAPLNVEEQDNMDRCMPLRPLRYTSQVLE